MNRWRRMAALASQELASRGIAAVTLDLFGTGDSEGEFEQASVELWMEDVRCALRDLASHYGGCRALIATLFAALLALQPSTCAVAQPERTILWHPATRGESLLTQFLRLRAAAGLRTSDPAKRETVAQARDRLLQGESLEVAGYVITPAMARGIDSLTLPTTQRVACGVLQWLDIGSSQGRLGADAERATDALRAQGHDVQVECLAGPQFWALPEITIAPAVLSRTVELFAGSDA
jgi:exosortase A-associated hydrolase 2